MDSFSYSLSNAIQYTAVVGVVGVVGVGDDGEKDCRPCRCRYNCDGIVPEEGAQDATEQQMRVSRCF